MCSTKGTRLSASEAPEGIEVAVARRALSGRRRRHLDSGNPQADGFLRLFERPGGVVEGHIADALQPRIGAEARHRPVRRASPGIEGVFVAGGAERRKGGGGEDQLAGETQFLDGANPLDRIGRAIGETPLGAADQAFEDLFGRGFRRRVRRRRAAQQPLFHGVFRERHQPVDGLHHMAVGVVKYPPAGVWHERLSPERSRLLHTQD